MSMKVQPVMKAHFDTHKDREKQNREKYCFAIMALGHVKAL